MGLAASIPSEDTSGLGALDVQLRQRCQQEAQRTVQDFEETIDQRFGRDRACAMPLPAYPFDVCIVQAAQMDKYQTVRFDPRPATSQGPWK